MQKLNIINVADWQATTRATSTSATVVSPRATVPVFRQGRLVLDEAYGNFVELLHFSSQSSLLVIIQLPRFLCEAVVEIICDISTCVKCVRTFMNNQWTRSPCEKAGLDVMQSAIDTFWTIPGLTVRENVWGKRNLCNTKHLVELDTIQ